MDQIIRESTYIMSDRSVCGDKKKSCLVFFGAFFSGAGAGFGLCRHVRELASTAATNSINGWPCAAVNTRNKLDEQ
jgi:hypothetical protein